MSKKERNVFELPEAFRPSSNDTDQLRKFKDSRFGKWSLNRVASLWDMCDFGHILMSLERYKDAISVFNFPIERIPFTGDYEIWTPVETCYFSRFQAECFLGNRGTALAALDVLSSVEHYVIEDSGIISRIATIRSTLHESRREVLSRIALLTTLRYTCTALTEAELQFEGSGRFPLAEFQASQNLALALLRQSFEGNRKYKPTVDVERLIREVTESRVHTKMVPVEMETMEDYRNFTASVDNTASGD